jgi:hypothetical protein
MLQGQVQIPATFDIHEQHIPEHNNFRMSVAYENAPTHIQEMVDDHIQSHETLAGEAAAKMAQRSMGGPGLGDIPSANADPAVPVDPGLGVQPPITDAMMANMPTSEEGLPQPPEPGMVEPSTDEMLQMLQQGM